MPATMKAYRSVSVSTGEKINDVSVGRPWAGKGQIQEIDVPSYEPNEVLVKVVSVALNPTDWKHVAQISPPGSTIGCDYAGVVEEVGSEVTNFKKGDRIAGLVHGGLFPDKGSFAEYLKIPSDLAWKIPVAVSFQDAATFGVGFVTACQTLFLNLDVPYPPPIAPTNPPKEILIYAGATSVGLFAIQLAKLCGYTVVTTCSPHSNDLVKSYGADFTYDYKTPTVVEDIVAAHPTITRALDGIAEGNTTQICADVVEKNGGGVVVTLLQNKAQNVPNVEIKSTLGYMLMGSEFQWFPPNGPKFPAVPELRASLVKFYADLPGWISDLLLKPNPIEVRPGGLDALEAGFADLQDLKVRGKKLVLDI